jgi:hypothetical protein
VGTVTATTPAPSTACSSDPITRLNGANPSISPVTVMPPAPGGVDRAVHLGHATTAETMDTYGHLFPDASEQGRGAVDAMFAAADVRPMCAKR